MARRQLKHRQVKLEDIKEEMKLIPGSHTDYITPSGNVYKDYGDGMYFKKKQSINPVNGYVYIGITFNNGKNKSCRVHRLVANAFIPNPNNYDIVGHKNNIKHDNRVDNLYWTTVQDNTQKAFDDGLAKNDKGYKDSQSMPIAVYKNGEFYRDFGSLKECQREMAIPIGTIVRRARNEVKTSYRKYKDLEFRFIQAL